MFGGYRLGVGFGFGLGRGGIRAAASGFKAYNHNRASGMMHSFGGGGGGSPMFVNSHMSIKV